MITKTILIFAGFLSVLALIIIWITSLVLNSPILYNIWMLLSIVIGAIVIPLLWEWAKELGDPWV